MSQAESGHAHPQRQPGCLEGFQAGIGLVGWVTAPDVAAPDAADAVDPLPQVVLTLEDLLNPGNSSATPGLYVLQALPTQLNASTLPVRRLFCRPRPFC